MENQPLMLCEISPVPAVLTEFQLPKFVFELRSASLVFLRISSGTSLSVRKPKAVLFSPSQSSVQEHINKHSGINEKFFGC